jgi:AraC-like DNA-binding protein
MDKTILLEQVEAYLLVNLDKMIQTYDLPKMFNTSYSTLSTHFLKKNNTTISAWFMEKKMNYAADLLKKGATVNEVASLTGYAKSASFPVAFEKYWKETPGNYRKRHNPKLFPIDEIKQYLMDRLSKNFDIPALLQAFPMNYNTLKKKFTEHAGKGVAAWFTMNRIEMARSLLCEGRSVKNVAAELGFSSDKNMIVVFKRHFGKTPGAYYVGRSAGKRDNLGEATSIASVVDPNPTFQVDILAG